MVAHGLVHTRTNESPCDVLSDSVPRQGRRILEQRALAPAHDRPRTVVVQTPVLSRPVGDYLVRDQTGS